MQLGSRMIFTEFQGGTNTTASFFCIPPPSTKGNECENKFTPCEADTRATLTHMINASISFGFDLLSFFYLLRLCALSHAQLFFTYLPL